jgi:uncharacterized membrane protein YdbT with pleckstrin-like domain
MYNSFRQAVEHLLRIPAAPEAPPGDEASARLFRAAPAYYRYLLIIWALRTFLAFVIVTVAMIGPVFGAVHTTRDGNNQGLFFLLIPIAAFLALLVFRLFSLALVRLDFEKRWYVVTDRSLRVREGVAIVKEMTVTFANIQNLAISQGPLQRAIGIADLRVDTAGGGAAQGQKHPGQNLHTAWLRGVNNAEEVRAVIQERQREFKDSGLGDHDEPLAAEPPAERAVLNALRELNDEARALREALT